MSESEDDWSARRREKRYLYETGVTIYLARSTVEAKSLDVSFRGFYLKADPPPAMRSFVRVRFEELGNHTGLEISGMVVHRVDSSDEEEEDKHAGVGIQLYGNGDDVLKTWNNFISEMASREPQTQEGEGTTVNLQAGYNAEVNDEIQLVLADQEELFAMYACKIPTGHMFIATDHNLAMGDQLRIDVSLEGHPASFPLHAEVIQQIRQPGNFGVEVAFLSLDTGTLTSFWDFICDRMPSSYPSMQLAESP